MCDCIIIISLPAIDFQSPFRISDISVKLKGAEIDGALLRIHAGAPMGPGRHVIAVHVCPGPRFASLVLEPSSWGVNCSHRLLFLGGGHCCMMQKRVKTWQVLTETGDWERSSPRRDPSPAPPVLEEVGEDSQDPPALGNLAARGTSLPGGSRSVCHGAFHLCRERGSCSLGHWCCPSESESPVRGMGTSVRGAEDLSPVPGTLPHWDRPAAERMEGRPAHPAPVSGAGCCDESGPAAQTRPRWAPSRRPPACSSLTPDSLPRAFLSQRPSPGTQWSVLPGGPWRAQR